jgi:hypothetical protein
MRVALLLLALAATASAQAPAQPPAAAPPAAPATGPEATGAFMCPMHPDVVKGEPGKCPRCNMDLIPGNPLALPDYTVKVATTPRVLKAGVPTRFTFTVHHPVSGEQAKEFAVIHEKLFHLFVISRDLEEFAHIHPDHHADGAFSIEYTLPKAGQYQLFADFLPMGSGGQITGIPISTAGSDSDIMSARARLMPDAVLAKTVDDVKVEIINERSTILGGEEVDLIFRFTDAKTDKPLTDLERYLGAFGHLVILSEDMTEYVHAHPREESQPDPSAPPTGGPEVLYDALLPKAGKYRAWLQFQRGGKLSTAVFTFNAPRPGETPD